MEPLVGRKILKRYSVEAFIGRGGMAEVYKVWDQNRAVNLAMKVLHSDLAEDIIFLRRFEREAQTLERLQHPNIVRFYGLEREGMLAFMMMDFIEGESLRTEIFRLNGEPFSLKRVVEIISPVCSALHYAHSLGMVHCDMKPSNILVDNNGEVLVADFGIARVTDAATMTMVGAGTPPYMAPEQIKGNIPLPQTDIYALGVVLFEMLAGGERPFTGELAKITGSTREKVLWEHMNTPPPPLQRWNGWVSPEIEAVVLKCLEKEPENRYPDTLTLLNDFTLAIERQIKLSVDKTGGEETWIALQDTQLNHKAQGTTHLAPTPTTPIFDGAVPKPTIGEKVKQSTVPEELRSPGYKWIWAVVGLLIIAIGIWGGINLLGNNNEISSGVILETETFIGNQVDTPSEFLSTNFTQTPNSLSKSPTPEQGSPTQTKTLRPTNTVAAKKPNSEIMLAYAFGSYNESDIYIYYFESGRTKRITNNNFEDRAPSFSWDNTRLVYQSVREGEVELYIYDLKTRKEEKITNFNGEAKFPCWSPIPGDERIVFEGREGESGWTNVWIVNSDGSGMERLTNSNADSRPFWSGNGEYIVFGRATRDSWEDGKISSADYLDIFKLELDSGKTTQLTNTINKDEFQYATSPEGNQIVFNSVEQDQNDDGKLNLVENRDIHIINNDGSRRYSIKIDNKHPLYAPGWSPDGRYLSFTLWFGADELMIILYDLNTDKTIELFGRGPYYHPEWSN